MTDNYCNIPVEIRIMLEAIIKGFKNCTEVNDLVQNHSFVKYRDFFGPNFSKKGFPKEVDRKNAQFIFLESYEIAYVMPNPWLYAKPTQNSLSILFTTDLEKFKPCFDLFGFFGVSFLPLLPENKNTLSGKIIGISPAVFDLDTEKLLEKGTITFK